MDALNKVWSRFFKFDWKFGLFVILLFGIPRFILVLQANVSGGYGLVSIIFVIMWFSPFIFLTRKGRKEIGLKKPRILQLLYSFVLGALFCGLAFYITHFIYGDSLGNSFAYISKSYLLPEGQLDANRFMFFITFAISGMIFSPIGEELFFRGIVHGSFVEQFGERKASFFDSAAFALTHLAHFGIIYNLGTWSFLPVPALLWVLFMFALSQLLFRCKQLSDSIFGAIVCHAGFNFAMIYFIFYHIL
ncbi:CPBP family intramembrane glutamic endopeptidase [Dysgonomonas sp. ZJ709]|uniref:CPBP family intramembrane glutamic endopeptidase n=1 Tax=Dysgonomonas sp. ZJ709 TaxID=2709797 RepID=UPI0013EBC2B0|nr:CPBP family intramembrane glutamic endopeptidase [Dysgonomonas sp. ZJ709]